MNDNDPLLKRRELEEHRYFRLLLPLIDDHPYKKDLTALHASVITKGGSILGIGINKPKRNFLVRKYAPHDHMTIHAEMDAIKNCYREDISGSKIYVLRLYKKNFNPAMSKPCRICHKIIQDFGIKRAYYSTYNKGICVVNANQNYAAAA